MTVRRISPDELHRALRVSQVAFGQGPESDWLADEQAVAEPDRVLLHLEGDEAVGTSAAYSFQLTVPGGGQLPMCGVTNVAVLPTHRRRGILRGLMGAQLDEAVERGDALAGLTASESSIYRRFGFGTATWRRRFRLAAAGGAMLRPPAPGGRMRLLAADAAAKVLPDVHERWRRRTPGELDRHAGWWELVLRDSDARRSGASTLQVVVHEDDHGTPDGYAAYRVADASDPAGLDAMELRVVELVGLDPEVEMALWRYLCDVDLVRTVVAGDQPVDPPLRHRLVDSRQLVTETELDMLWLRLLDVPRCLTARAYPVSDRLVLEVVDPFRPSAGGRFVLDATPEGAACEPTGAEPDVVLDVADLSAAYLGGTPVERLHAAGLIDERAPQAAARLDRLLAWSPAPRCSTEF